MTGKAYYITTLGDWQRHAARFANSHFVVLDSQDATIPTASKSNCGDVLVGARHAVPGAGSPECDRVQHATVESAAVQTGAGPEPSPERGGESPQDCQASSPGTACRAPTDETLATPDAEARILVLIEADEGVHLALEDDAAFQPLPHPLAQKPIPDAAQAALAPHGVAPGATTFDAAEAVARVHPLLRHRVF
jgi:hypothetical protein